jgi:hypothetical protein
MRWTRKAIVEEVRRLHSEGAELSYAAAEQQHLNLVRAATWHYGSWRIAVEASGVDYDSVSKYQRWGRRRIIERIRELHAQGKDLSWREVSTHLDPALAAAALRPNGFTSWRDAIAAAGLDIESIARYQHWTPERIVGEIKALHEAGSPLSSKMAQMQHQGLFCAARRYFGTWDAALEAAGLDASAIRLRRLRQSSLASVPPAPEPPAPKGKAGAKRKTTRVKRK